MDEKKEINIIKILILVILTVLLSIYIGWTLKVGELIGPPLARKGFGVTIGILIYCIFLLYQEIKIIVKRLS